MSDDYGLYSDFDVEKHQNHFVNYLEVVIDLDGVVHYAIPSHQEYMIQTLMRMGNLTRQQVYDMCPEQYYADFMTWLSMETGYVVVWDCGYLGYTINSKQREVLDDFIERGLMEDNEMICR